jgi:hypothetical protein
MILAPFLAVTTAPWTCSPPARTCIDPWTHARAAWRDVPGGLHEESLDLDADGTDDLLIAADGLCGSGGCGYLAYLRRGRCAIFVGSLYGREQRLLPTVRGGLHDVHIESHSGYCPYTTYVAWFDGVAYQQTVSAQCACDASAPDGVRCTPAATHAAPATIWRAEPLP